MPIILKHKYLYCIGKSIVVTGVPPMGRKNVDKLVELYGGKLVKAIAKKTSFVVLGNDAGPKKLEQIKEFGLKSYTDIEFVKLIESGMSNLDPALKMRVELEKVLR